MTIRWKFTLSVIIVFFFFGVINLALNGGGGVVKIALVAVGLSLIWSNQNQKLFKAIVSVAVTVAVWVFLSLWPPTKPAMEWFSHRAEERTPRDNYNPKAENPVALVRFYEQGDGRVVRVGADWRIHPVTGEPLALPGSEEFLRLLTKYEVQKVQDEVKDKPLAAQVNKACTYCLGNGCETTHPATILGPGWMEIRSEQYGTTASFNWKLNGEGSWTQAFPESGGTLKWNDANYEKGVLRGVVTDTTHTPGGNWPVVLTCNGQIPIPRS